MEQTEHPASAPGSSDGVVTISVDTGAARAAQVMQENRIGCLVVVNDTGHLVGIVSERDILKWIGTASPESFSARVGDIMTAEVVTCTPETSPGEAYGIMLRYSIRHLPIVEGGRPVGMLSMRDLMCRQGSF